MSTDLAKLLAQLAEMQEQIRVLSQQSAPQGDDWTALDPTALDAPKMVMKRGAYNLVRASGTVCEPYEADWPALFAANPFIAVPLTQKRQEIARILRYRGVSTKPEWFDKVVSKEVHNAGIMAHISGLQREIEAWQRKIMP